MNTLSVSVEALEKQIILRGFVKIENEILNLLEITTDESKYYLFNQEIGVEITEIHK